MRPTNARATRSRFVLVTVALALAVASCGDAQDSPTTSEADDMPEPTTTPEPGPPTVTGPADPPTDDPDGPEPEVQDPPAPDGSAPEAPRPYASFAVKPAGTGSNPLLEWEPVDGATLYRLVVLDAAGNPYWAWSGAATAARLGASEEPTAIGARVFEPMTWQVSAYDDGGTPPAFSDVGTLLP